MLKKKSENGDKNRAPKRNILIIAGEPSGDARGAELVTQLKPLLNNVEFWGFGGDLMAEEGVEIVRHIRDLSMVGAVEIIHKLPEIFRHFRQIKTLVRERKPDMAILIDYPGFNLKVARFLNSVNIPVVYYIIPQVWAWGKNRLKKIKRFVKKALVLFPFEETLLRDNGIDCDFVGHPLADSFIENSPGEETPGDKNRPRIALLAGSRKHEIDNILPIMLDAAEIIKAGGIYADFYLAESPNIPKETYDHFLSSHEGLAIKRFRADTAGTLRNCDMAVITSGTATLEGAMMEKPMVIVYKASRITYLFYLLLSRIPFLGLVNIIAGKEIAPELLQDKLSPDTLAKTVLKIIKDPELSRKMKKDLRKVRLSLGEKGAAERAARSILSLFLDLNNHSR